jgi:hypothetical protein
VGVALRVFTQTPPFGFECAADLLRAHFAPQHPLLVFSRVPLRCAFNATFRVSFQPARDRLPPGSRHLHSLFSLVFPLVVFSILPVFVYFSIAISLYVFFYLFLLFGCFFIFVLLFLCMFFFPVFACNKVLSFQIVLCPCVYLHLVQTFGLWM